MNRSYETSTNRLGARLLLPTVHCLMVVAAWFAQRSNHPSIIVAATTADRHHLNVPNDVDEGAAWLRRAESDPSRRRASFIDRFRFASPTSCIGDDKQLRSAVENVPTGPRTTPTVITICSRIKISNVKNIKKGNVTGIDISNKNIDLRCSNPRGWRCVLDGQQSSRILFGSSAIFRATSIDFINGYVPKKPNLGGSALFFDANSTVTLNQCSFRRNRNDSIGGGALAMNTSVLTLRGIPTSPMVFADNSAFYGSAISTTNTKVRALTGNIIFRNNTGGGALNLYGSDSSWKGIVVVGNIGTSNAGGMNVQSGILAVEDSSFVNNTVNDSCCGAVGLNGAVASFKGVEFLKNSGLATGGLGALFSAVTLENCTFWNEDSLNLPKSGADLSAGFDDTDPADGGAFIDCTKDVIFCKGTGKTRIYDYPGNKNTNCIEKGITRVCRRPKRFL